MSLAKPALVGIIAVAAYFIFFSNSLPKNIEYRGNSLGPRQDVENDSIKNFDIVSYNDKTNYHILLFLLPGDESVTTQELVDFYVVRFEAQGYMFKKDGNKHLGVKGDEVVYMTIAANMNAAVAYIEKDPTPLPRKPSDANDVFSSLVDFSFN